MSKKEENEQDESYKDKLKYVNEIAQPLAKKKLSKKILKLIKSAAASKKENLIYGVKAVQKAIRKDEHGIIILAGDYSPIDILSHIPGLCEEKNIPYIYVPSRKDIGEAMGTQRSILVVLLKLHSSYEENYNYVKKEISEVNGGLIWDDVSAP